MTIELRILSGSRAGARERFNIEVVTLGRHPLSNLRFDPQVDLDVSARHAELRKSDGEWSINDLQSTNGTFVNSERITGTRVLATGDLVRLGANGPQVEVQIGGRTSAVTVADALRVTTEPPARRPPPVRTAPAARAKPSARSAPPVDTAPSARSAPPPRSAPPRRDTNVRIAEAVEVQTASLRRRFAMALGGVVVVVSVVFAFWQRQASSRERELMALIARSDSASAPLQRTIAAMQARDSQFARQLSQRESASAREAATGRAMAGGKTNVSKASMALLSERVAIDTRLRQALTQMDFPRVHDLNDAAVALLASDMDGTFVAGTAFAISNTGELVTNRHVVRSAAGQSARRIRVLFANSTEWLNARIVRVSDNDDLALLQVEGGGPYPVVAGVSRAGAETRVGSPVATIGFPHAVDTPMEGSGLNVRARTTTTAGTVSKRLGDVLQIDSYAGRGSSGSPVFDVRGFVVGVIYGGEKESGGRIVYAVPAERVAAFLGAGEGKVLRE